jgi:hypothetical protein
LAPIGALEQLQPSLQALFGPVEQRLLAFATSSACESAGSMNGS